MENLLARLDGNWKGYSFINKFQNQPGTDREIPFPYPPMPWCSFIISSSTEELKTTWKTIYRKNRKLYGNNSQN